MAHPGETYLQSTLRIEALGAQGGAIGGMEVSRGPDGGYLASPDQARELARLLCAGEMGARFTVPAAPPVLPASGDNLLRIADGKVTINPGTLEVFANKQPIYLSRQEYGLLAYLAAPERIDKIQPTAEILWQVWGYMPPSGANTVKVHAFRIREALAHGSSELRDAARGALRCRRGIGWYAVSSLSVGEVSMAGASRPGRGKAQAGN